METNLSAIKEITISLAKATPVTSAGEGILENFATHPFIDNILWHKRWFEMTKDLSASPDECSVNLEDLDLRKEEVYNKWLLEFAKMVNNCTKLFHIYMLWRKPYKMLFVSLFADALSESDFAEYLADAWVEEEYPNADVNVSKKEALALFKRADKKKLMTEDEYKAYKALPEKVTVYRGVNGKGSKDGISWTLDKEKAKWFANRWGNNGKIYQLTVSKDDILAFFDGRSEKEVIINIFSYKGAIKRA